MKTLLTAAALFAATQAAMLPAPGLAQDLAAPTTSGRPETASTPLRLAGPAAADVGCVGDHGRPPGTPRGFGPDRPPLPPEAAGFRGRRGPPTTEMLAVRLAAMEVAVGVRADQIDAWRHFTDALIGVLAPPEPPPVPGEAKQPFALAGTLAKDAVERGRHAEALQRAIAALETTLSPDQLRRLARFQPRLAPPDVPKGPPPVSPEAGVPAPEPPAGPVE